MKFQFQLNFKRTFRVQAHPGQPDDWWPLNKFVATCKTTFIADAKIGPLECRQKPLKLIASNADELYQIVLHYFQRGQFDANISNRFAKKSMVAKLIWWWQATHLRKWKIVSASKQASIFICQQKWQATKKAIGSTMLAAHSKHNSKKNQLTPQKKHGDETRGPEDTDLLWTLSISQRGV